MHTMLCGEEMISAANQDASPTNQRRAYGNACGPAALLNAFHYGSKKWQRPYNAVPGDDSKSRIDYVISKWGLSQSKHIKGMQRWNQQQGINLSGGNGDLDVVNFCNQRHCLHGKATGAKITRHPTAQIFSLAHIQELTFCIVHLVYARAR